MATVFVPSLLRKLTDGREQLLVPGATVRAIIDGLEAEYPGVKERLVEGFKLKSNITVAIDGTVGPMGLLEKVDEDSEVHFLPALGGGSPIREIQHDG